MGIGVSKQSICPFNPKHRHALRVFLLRLEIKRHGAKQLHVFTLISYSA